MTILSTSVTLKTFSQNPEPESLVKYLSSNYPGAEYYSVYEAGFCGYWAHHEFISLVVHNIVVNPADVPTTVGEKLRKTDAVNRCKLAKTLRAGLLKGIYIPNRESLETRSLVMLRSLLTKNHTRQKNRIKSFLYFHGIEIPKEFYGSHCWCKNFVKWLKNIELSSVYGRQTLDFLISNLEPA